MSIQSVTVDQLARLHHESPVNLIDVRTPREFESVHAEMAQNVPLDKLDPKNLLDERNGCDKPLYVICLSGGRSSQACQQLIDAGHENVINIEGGTNAWTAANLPVVTGRKAISLERQVRILAGAITFAGSLAAILTENIYFAGIPAFIGAGLVFAGVTDTCGMGIALSKMPWNR